MTTRTSVERRQIERAEPFVPVREDALAGGFLGNEELAQRRHIRLRELIAQRLEPARVQLDGHRARLIAIGLPVSMRAACGARPGQATGTSEVATLIRTAEQIAR